MAPEIRNGPVGPQAVFAQLSPVGDNRFGQIHYGELQRRLGRSTETKTHATMITRNKEEVWNGTTEVRCIAETMGSGRRETPNSNRAFPPRRWMGMETPLPYLRSNPQGGDSSIPSTGSVGGKTRDGGPITPKTQNRETAAGRFQSKPRLIDRLRRLCNPNISNAIDQQYWIDMEVLA